MFIGFKDEKRLVEAVAKAHGEKPFFAEVGFYRAGEMRVSSPAKASAKVSVVSDINEDPSSLFRVLLLAEALRRAGVKKLTLVAPWIAYGRQDRVTKKGESPAGLVVARSLASAFDRIVTLDAHSPEFMKFFGGKLKNVLPLARVLPPAFRDMDVVVAPDQGAIGRARALATSLGVGYAVVRKNRLANGVKSFMAKADENKVQDKRILLVDDMTDSGATLAAAADVCRKAGAVSVKAAVTHAMDLDGLKRQQSKKFDGLFAGYDHQKVKIVEGVVKLLT